MRLHRITAMSIAGLFNCVEEAGLALQDWRRLHASRMVILVLLVTAGTVVDPVIKLGKIQECYEHFVIQNLTAASPP